MCHMGMLYIKRKAISSPIQNWKQILKISIWKEMMGKRLSWKCDPSLSNLLRWNSHQIGHLYGWYSKKNCLYFFSASFSLLNSFFFKVILDALRINRNTTYMGEKAGNISYEHFNLASYIKSYKYYHLCRQKEQIVLNWTSP